MADLKHLLRHRLWKEHVVDLKTDKVFCSQWLNDRKVVFGTKCNKLMLYDTTRQVLDQIPLLNGRLNASAGFGYTAETQIGICSAQINPSRTFLATRGKNSTEVAIYKLPSLDPFCVGEQGHKDWIIGPCWLDDEFLVSASNDSKITLWKIKSDSSDGTSEKTGVSMHRLIKPVWIKKEGLTQQIESLLFNKTHKEIAASSMNNLLHIWASDTFEQKLSLDLSSYMSNKSSIGQNICLAVSDGGRYGVGCGRYTILVDSRKKKFEKIPTMHGGGIRSMSFRGPLLTIGTLFGMLMFFDTRAVKYLESSKKSNQFVILSNSKGRVYLAGDRSEQTEYTATIFTHCYDAAGTRLFSAGGPLARDLCGNYAGIWHCP